MPRFPLLAPLFDNMTTRVVSERFTAAEAFAFLEQALSQLTIQDFQSAIVFKGGSMKLGYTGSYWTLLPTCFCEKWAAFKSPPPFLVERLLEKVAVWKAGWCILRFVRRVVRA